MKASRTILLVVLVAFLGLFLLYPLAYSCRKAVMVDGRFTLLYFKYFYTDELLREAIVNSLAIGVVVTLATALLALPLSFLMA